MRAGTICHGKLMLSEIRKERTSEEKTMHDICKLHFNSIYKKHSKALAKLNHSHHLIPSHQSRANERSNNDLNSKTLIMRANRTYTRTFDGSQLRSFC